MPSGHSVLEYTGDGVTDTYAVNFTLGYIDKSHIQCRVGTEVDGSMNPVYRTLADVPGDPGRMRITGAVPGAGVKILFRRIVPKTVLQNDFADGAAIEDTALDDSFKQPIMMAHELLDGFGLETVYSDINLTGHKIKNVYTDANDPASLATVEYVGQAPVHAAAAAASAATAITAKNQAVTASTNASNSASAAATSALALGSALLATSFTAAWDFIVGQSAGVAIKKTLSEVFAAFLTLVGAWTKQQYAVPVVNEDMAGTFTVLADSHQAVSATITGPTTITAPTNSVIGKTMFFHMYSAGAYALTWDGVFKSTDNNTLPTTTTTEKRLYLQFYCYDGTNWSLIGMDSAS